MDSISPSKHRGINRATWSMRLKGARVPPAASAAFQAALGPRVLPGAYTVKMTKNDKVYTTQLNVVLDPRATYTVEDRKQQFDLVNKLAAQLNHMSWAVEAIIGVRDAALADAAKLPATDALKQQLGYFAQKADAIRSQIVATKEGGAITGEERLREFLAGLYGDVNGYDGKPTNQQVQRADALARELEDVIKQFNTFTEANLAKINSALAAKNLPPIKVISEADWQKANAGQQP